MPTENSAPARYRIRVQTQDGQEVVSEPLTLSRKAGGALVSVHLKVEDGEGHPHVSRPFEIHAGQAVIQGFTSPDGVIDAKVPKADEAELLVRGAAGEQRYTLSLDGRATATLVQGA